MSPPLTVNHLSHAGKDALIHSLLAEIQALTTRAADLEARSGGPPKTPGNASVPPSKGQKVNQPGQTQRIGPHARHDGEGAEELAALTEAFEAWRREVRPDVLDEALAA